MEPANERVSRAANSVEHEAASSARPRALDDGTKSGKPVRRVQAHQRRGRHVRLRRRSRRAARRRCQSGQGLDCSSSSSLALKRAGLFSDNVAWVSGRFASSYGQPGPGQHFTVWANGGHVWIEFHGLGAAKRFDTSPHGSGGRGPRLRYTPRSTSGFVARHWPGC
jgi:hypothetical protein